MAPEMGAAGKRCQGFQPPIPIDKCATCTILWIIGRQHADGREARKVLIRIFADDHNPSHFHVLDPDGEMLVLLSDLSAFRGAIDRRSLNVALRWAEENKELLENEWERLNKR